MNTGKDNFAPVYDSIPEKWEDARGMITESLRRITNTTNSKDGGAYVDEEQISGQQFVPGTGKDARNVLRKVVKVGPLPDAGTSPKQVAHGISTTADTRITRIYGAATTPGAPLVMGIPLPFVDMPGGHHIGLTIDGTNINITVDADYTAYTDAYVVVEYVQES